MPGLRSISAGAALAGGLAGLLLSGCGAAPAGTFTAHASAAPSGGLPAQGSGCVSQSEAMRIWTDINDATDAMEADPKAAMPSVFTSGAALAAVQQYLAQQLVANNWTEHEVDRLDALSIVDAGCNNGTLQLHVTITVVTDEYLTANGQVDHHDTSEGQQAHLSNSYVRFGGKWKETELLDLDQATPAPSGPII
ncbi:MAG TPA: hypothetical protein VF155_03865 [Candidatus Dormibacteraeota bacterium]